MISIQPKHLLNILNGYKTLELRKNVPKDFKGWVYIYCTKGKDILEYSFLGYRTLRESSFYNNGIGMSLNGKVVARFWFDEYIAYKYHEDDNSYFAKRPQDFGYNAEEVLERLCLSRDEFKAYGKGKDLYAWHIKKLEIFDTPLSLSDFYVHSKDFYTADKYGYENENLINYVRITKAPQSWRYVYYAN
jgi:predicted transcriptional regulator